LLPGWAGGSLPVPLAANGRDHHFPTASWLFVRRRLFPKAVQSARQRALRRGQSLLCLRAPSPEHRVPHANSVLLPPAPNRSTRWRLQVKTRGDSPAVFFRRHLETETDPNLSIVPLNGTRRESSVFG